MQLFTIGLHQLEFDGSETRDEFGRMIQTYTNEDIMTNARIWTGFVYTARRGNTEELFRSAKSRFEPLRIDIDRYGHGFSNMTSLIKFGDELYIFL